MLLVGLLAYYLIFLRMSGFSTLFYNLLVENPFPRKDTLILVCLLINSNTMNDLCTESNNDFVFSSCYTY